MTHVAERIVSILLENAPSIRGEYWIVDGSVMFADGDVGDMNHEGYAIDHARRRIIEEFGGDSDDEFIDDSDIQTAVVNFFAEEGTPIDPADWTGAAEQHLKTLPDAVKEVAVFHCALGMGDAREVAKRYWGWKWVRHNNVATWTFDNNDRRSIISGLEEIGDQEVVDDGTENWDDLVVVIHVGLSGLRHDMTLGELKSGRTPSQDPTWGKMRHNESEEDPMLTDMGNHVAEISTNRKMRPGEEVSRGTLITKDLIRRTIDKLKEIHYDGWKDYLEDESRSIAALDEEPDNEHPYEPPLEDFMWDRLITHMNSNYVPYGCHFGHNEGSAADVGCWPSYDYLKEPGTEEMVTTLDRNGVRAREFLNGKYEPITEYVLLEHPSGTMEMYTADGELIWSY